MSLQRIPEIDYLKCVLILLMVAFHLVYIGDNYPYAKQIVYTFHMPGFLLISGYLAQSMKDLRKGGRKVLWIFSCSTSSSSTPSVPTGTCIH